MEQPVKKCKSPVQPRLTPPFTCVWKVGNTRISVDNSPVSRGVTLVKRFSLQRKNLYPQKQERKPWLSTTFPQLGVKRPNLDISTPTALYLVFSRHLNSIGELGDLVIDRASLSHKLADFSVSVHHCGVITAAERLTYFWQRELCEFAT